MDIVRTLFIWFSLLIDLIFSGYVSGIIKNSTITKNFASNLAGGIYMAGNANITLDSVHLIDNHALLGGCLVFENYCSSFVTNCNFQFCSASTSGGAVLMDDYSNPIMDQCTIQNSYATSIGSGIFVLGFATPTIQNSTIR